MKNEYWAISRNAPEMLRREDAEHPNFLATQITQLHKFLIACCWKHEHLIPQQSLRNGLVGAEKWLAGDLPKDELLRLERYAEGEAFMLDYAKTDEELAELAEMVRGIPQLDGMEFEEARELMKDAAYFTDGAIIYSMFRRLPWVRYLLTSSFLCPDLLREYIEPVFD
jgi:hypothetical protein